VCGGQLLRLWRGGGGGGFPAGGGIFGAGWGGGSGGGGAGSLFGGEIEFVGDEGGNWGLRVCAGEFQRDSLKWERAVSYRPSAVSHQPGAMGLGRGWS